EAEIPAWFEQAARKMLAERSGGISGDISLAELTLVTQTPAPQSIAAASRTSGGGHAPSAAPSPQHAGGAEKDQVDIDKVATEIYRDVLVMMDVARSRNGEPYL